MRALAIALALAAGCTRSPLDVPPEMRRIDAAVEQDGGIDAAMLPPPGPGCGLDAAAFCETFDAPHPGGRGGEIDERRFAFSRWGFSRGEAESRGYRDGVWIDEWSNPDGPPVLCGEEFSG